MEWLGDVPEHWGMNRLGVHFRNRKEKVSDKDFKPLSVTKHGIVPQLEHAAKSDNGDNRKLVRKGDYVINSRSDRKGSSGLADLDGSVSLINIVLTPFKTIHPKFSHYLLRSYLFQEEFYKYGHGIVADLWTTNYEDMRNIHLALPSVSEQTQIANYLDQETQKIDTLIAKQEKLIELLEEQRKSIISHAVTKGLNPNAPMKDSGVEWLGDVPESWEVIPSKFYFTERKEKAVNGDKQLTASQKHGIIYQDEFIAENGRVMVVMKNPEILKKVRPNDFVISMRSFQGGLELSSLEGSISSAYVMLKPDLSLINTEYFKYLFKTPRYIQSLQSTSNLIRDGQALRFNNFSQVKLVLPPKSEQQEIVEYLDKEKNKIDNLIYKQKTLIEKLKEYRSSIISHAVTGKIDIREFC